MYATMWMMSITHTVIIFALWVGTGTNDNTKNYVPGFL